MKVKKRTLIFDRGKAGRERLGLVTEEKYKGFAVKDFNGRIYYIEYSSRFDQDRVIAIVQTNSKVKTVQQAIKMHHCKIIERLLDEV